MKFNPFIFSGFDSGGNSGSTPGFGAPVASEASLPLVGNADGDTRATTDSDKLWVWDAATSRWIDVTVTVTTFGSTPNANGYSITLTNTGANRTERRLELQPADATNPGLVSTGTQSFGGAKTFNSSLTVLGSTTLATSLTGLVKATSGVISASSLVNADVDAAAAIARSKLASGTADHVLINNGSGVMSSEAVLSLSRGGTGTSSTPTNGQLLIGNGTNYTLATLTGTSNQVSVSNAAGSITLSTPQDIAATSTPTFGGLTLTAFSGVVKAVAGVLSASSVVNADIDAAAAIARSKIASGTANHVIINDGTGVLSSESTLALSRGGTGLGTTPTNGQLLIGNGSSYTLATLSGTTDQIAITNGVGSITLSTPQNIATTSSPTFAGLTLTAFSGVVKSVAGVLSASSVVNADIDVAAAIARSKLASGTANHVIINDGTGVLSSESTLSLSRGGTGLGTTPTNGQLLIGNGTNYSLATITGTSNQVSVTNGAGTITLSTPQDIAAASSPTFAGLTLTAFSGVVKASAGVLSASTIVNADVNASAAIARSKLASGTADHVLINDGSGVMSSEATLSLSRGGTGLATTPTNGQLLIGNGTNYTLATLSGTADQVSITNGSGSITLSLPQNIATTSSPTFAGLTLTAFSGVVKAVAGTLSASTIVNADINTAAAIARSKLASGSANHVLINDGTGVMSSESALAVSRGGTALSTTPTNGQLLIGDGVGYTLATISGTSNQVSVSNGVGSITLSLPQDVAASSSPTFAGLTLTAFSGVVKATAGVLSASAVSLTADVSGVLPIANGGTNSSTALNNNRIVVSSGGALVEASAITANRALQSNASGIPVASSVTATELGYVSGVTSSIQTQIDGKISSTEKGANNGVATLDSGGKIPTSQLPSTVMEYKGNWDASSNTPTLADGVGNTGDVYRVSVAGTQDLGSGSITFVVGDWVVYNGSIWEKSLNSNAVTSVNGQTGVVVLSTTNISEGTNLYFTDERAQDAVGGALTNTTTIDFTYNDLANTISASVNALSLTNSQISTTAAIARTKLASGTADHVLINDGSGVMSSEATLSISRGGTGLGTAPSNGQLLIGNGTTYTQATLTGTSNRVSVSNGAGTITLSTPQDIHAGASPTFAGLTLTAFSGTVKAVAGVLSAATIVNADIDVAAAIARSKLAAGTADHVIINDGSGNFSSEAVLSLSRGGTGTSTTPTNGQLLIGNGTNYSVATLTGTSNQVTVTNGAGSITLSLPQNIATGSSPTFAGLTLTTFSGTVKAVAGVLSASTIVNADIDAAAAIARSKLAAGSANHVVINDGTGNFFSEATLALSRGGTGVNTVPSNGQLLIGNGTGYTVTTITGTANQVSVSNGSGSITLSTPQDIATVSSPTFAGLTLTAFSGVVKASAGVLSAAAIVNADVDAAAAIARTKLASGTADHVLINNGSGVMSSEASLAVSRGGTGLGTTPTNGQLLIGNGSGYTQATISAGTGINVSNGAGSITISAGSTGDIAETSFTAADNQVAAANVTGFAFANATVRSFSAHVSIVRNSTYSKYTIEAIQKAASWEMSQSYVGDDCGITFSITSAGQVQYTSTNTGSSATVKFRALVTTV